MTSPNLYPGGADEKRAHRLASTPPKYKVHFQRAWKGNSRLSAVTAMCLECCGFDVKVIKNCTAPACPLWEYRPYQGDDSGQRFKSKGEYHRWLKGCRG